MLIAKTPLILSGVLASFYSLLDLRKIPVTPDTPPPSKTRFSAVGVATATPPSDKTAFEPADGAPVGNEVLRKSSLFVLIYFGLDYFFEVFVRT